MTAHLEIMGLEATGLAAEHLHKSFADRQSGEALPVLQDVSLTVRRGELVALIGPSGCGKSTLLNLVAGLERADAGRLRLPWSGNRQPRIGYIFQQPRLLDWCSLRRNVELAVEAAGADPANTDRMIEAVGLTGYADAFPTTLSGGQRQRAAVARAFAIEPDILLLDEPFSALDELTAQNLRDLLQKLWLARPRVGLFVTHNTLEAALLADRVAVFSPRPARLVEEIEIDLPRPRRADDERLFRYHKIVQAALAAAV